MYLSGFADEATPTIEDQVAVIRELGWDHIDLRAVEGTPVHDLDDAAFDRVLAALDAGGVTCSCVGSAIAAGRSSIDDAFSIALGQVERAIKRMQQLGCTRVRIMSWPIKDEDRRLDEPTAAERFRRLREIHQRFADAGISALHENCFNYGGQSWQHTMRLIEEVPGLRLIFDTANPIKIRDQSYGGDPKPCQSVFELWAHVREYVDYIHIKDGVYDPIEERFQHGWPGEGMGDVRAVLRDAIARGYDDAVAIEPHIGGLQLIPDLPDEPDARKRAQWLEYGRRMEALLQDIGAPIAQPAMP